MSKPSPGSTSADNSTDLTCPECGYDLRAIRSDRCPECGKEFDRETLSASRVPWAHRREIGFVRAYWRTVVMATFEPTRLGKACAAPVNFSDARRFRWLTVALASVAIGCVLFINIAESGAGPVFGPSREFLENLQKMRPSVTTLSLPFFAGYQLWPASLVCATIFFILVSGVNSYWFESRSLPILRRNRAVAISLYCCAPLAWFVIPSLLFLGFLICLNRKWVDMHTPLSVIVAFLVPILFWGIWIAMWIGTIKVLNRAHENRSRRSKASSILFLPISWLAMGAISFLILPWLIGLLWIMVDSLI